MFSNDRKDNLIQLRVTKTQKEFIKKAASDKGMSITEFIFSLIQKELQENKSN